MASAAPAGDGASAGSKVSLFSGSVTRTWAVTVDGTNHTVTLNHHTLSGSRVVAVDGQEIEGTDGSSTLLSGPTELSFEVGSHDLKLSISPVGGAFRYAMTLDGESVSEENELVSKPSAAKLEVSVPSTTSGVDEKGERVIWYLVETRRPDGRVVQCHRRFRDFFGVNEQVRSSFKGSHLLKSLPRPPARRVTLFADHFSDAFIEERRAGLEKFLRDLQAVPRASTNADLLSFLGTMESTRETSVLFPAGPLGLTIRPDRGWVVVVDFKTLDDGSPGPAEAAGVVSIGDRVSKINGETVLGWTHDQVVEAIKASRRPMMLHFLGYYPIVTHGEVSAATGAGASAGTGFGAAGAAGAGEESKDGDGADDDAAGRDAGADAGDFLGATSASADGETGSAVDGDGPGTDEA